MGKSKFTEVAYEFSNLWDTMSRAELCEYYDVTDRTISNWKKALSLPKNQNVESKVATNPIQVIVEKDGTNKKQSFKTWNHIVNWFKAQRYPVTIDTNNKSEIVCKLNTKHIKQEALNLEKLLEK